MTVQTVYKGYSSFLTVEPGYTSGISSGSRQQATSLDSSPLTIPAANNDSMTDTLSTPYKAAMHAHKSMQETSRMHPWEEVDHTRSMWVGQELDKQLLGRNKGQDIDMARHVSIVDIHRSGYLYNDTGGVDSGEMLKYRDLALVKDTVRFAATAVDRDVATFDQRQLDMDRQGGDPKAVWESMRGSATPDVLDNELNRLNAAMSDSVSASEMPSGFSKSRNAAPEIVAGKITSTLTNNQYTINTDQGCCGGSPSFDLKTNDRLPNDGEDSLGKEIGGVLFLEESRMPTGLPEAPSAKIVLRQNFTDLSQSHNESDENLRFKQRAMPAPDRKNMEILRRDAIENFEGSPEVRGVVDTAYITQPYLVGLSENKTWREISGPSVMGVAPVDVKSQAISDKEVAVTGRIRNRSTRPEIIENTYSGERFTRNRADAIFDNTPLGIDYPPMAAARGDASRSDSSPDRLIHPVSDGRLDLGARIDVDSPAMMNRSHTLISRGPDNHTPRADGKVTPDQKARKIIESSLFGRNDSRIQEVIVMTERIDPFGLIGNVNLLVSSAAGDARYNAQGAHDAVMVKGHIVDRLGLDWSGGKIQSASYA